MQSNRPAPGARRSEPRQARGERRMFVKFTSTDRVSTVVNAMQISFISSVEEGTRIRFGEGRSVTVIEPMEEVLARLNRTQQLPLE